MTFGFRTYKADGSVSLDVSDRTSRVILEVTFYNVPYSTTPTYDRYIDIPANHKASDILVLKTHKYNGTNTDPNAPSVCFIITDPRLNNDGDRIYAYYTAPANQPSRVSQDITITLIGI